MAVNVLQTLRAERKGHTLRQLAAEIGVTQPYLSMLINGKRPVTPEVERKIQACLTPKPSASLTDTLSSFIAKGTHKSPKTKQALRERVGPFIDYLADQGVRDPLIITRQHIDGFLQHIAEGRRGKPLSAASAYGFTKDVKAFVNFIADTLAPDDWRNPVRKLQTTQPRTTIRPMSRGQVDALIGVIDGYSPTDYLKARNKAMLYVLLDGALRISELLTATRYQLSQEGILSVVGKGQKEREVALAPVTLEAIDEYISLRRDVSPYLIVSEAGGPLTYEAIKSLFHRWRDVAPEVFQGVRLSAHTLRHTSATMRRIAGMSEGDLQTFLGHSTPAMTRHYSQFALARSANAAAVKTSPIQDITFHNS